MYIFLGVVGELATILGSIAITLNAGIDSILEISKNGYKINKSALDEVKKRQDEENEKKNSGVRKILGAVLLLFPGVNLINASIKSAKIKKSLINDPEVKEVLIPMTDKEKEQFAKMEGKFQKLTFTSFTTVNENEEEEFFGFVGKRPIVVDHGITTLFYEELMPLNYTLDEVKRLNDATTYSYRIGKIDGKNVAIIGIPNPDSPVSKIQFESEDYKITHTYEKMSEDEAKDKTFTVYPFTTYNNTKENLEMIIEEIKQSRIDNAVNANLETLKSQGVFEQDYISTNTEESLTEEQQGPVLKKTLNSKRK